MERDILSNRSKKLNLESLEGRWLMAGDVTVNVIGGNLFIVGDDASNHIVVSDGAAAGDVDITGVGTDVNGGASHTASGVTGNIFIVMRGGGDQVDLEDLNTPKNLAVTMDDGNDTLNIGLTEPDAVTVGRSAALALGPGNDTLNANYLHVIQELAIQAGTGNDDVNLGSVVTVDLDIIARDLVVNLGRGENTFNGIGLDVKRAIGIGGGNGDNTINLTRVEANIVAIATGDGDDEINIDDLTARHVGLSTGKGNDDATIENAQINNLGVEMWAGDDELSIGGSNINRAAMDGGKGTNTFNNLGGNTFGTAIRRRFQIVTP